MASARRGVTDHLLGLVEQVREAVPRGGASSGRAAAAADRAVASGELVAASLLAVALAELDIPAVVLDAREAGLHSTGAPGTAALTAPNPSRLERLLARGLTPVVTGFQGWHRGRLTTLGRGGSDITAVALAGALGAECCELVKDPGALHTADPRIVPDAQPIERASHRFVSEIALAGARVIHHAAAVSAEREGVPLSFTSAHAGGEPATAVFAGDRHPEAWAVVLGEGHRSIPRSEGDPAGVATVTLVGAFAGSGTMERAAHAVAGRAGARVLRTSRRPHAVGFLVPAAQGEELARGLHAALDPAHAEAEPSRRTYACHR